MSTEENNTDLNSITNTSLHDDATWGPWMLRITLAGTLIFMWWLVIYDHGVVSHH
ncbi:MAG: hypothetical protein KZQ83_11620 [gamma proteobacterium symbiont of Taylorina sp.]|nr:hypothetical protein [gamma proteobacterium symbiont of Taylorina sp.]